MFARLDMRRLTVIGLLMLTCALLLVGLTNTQWCMPALCGALVFATALGTWWLARDDLALITSGSGTRLVLTGVSLGLGITWAGAGVAALLDASPGAPWANAEFASVLRSFIEDVARHWTPLGLTASLFGTGLSLILAEIGGDASARNEQV